MCWRRRRRLFLIHGETATLAAMRENVLTLGLDPDKIIVPDLDQRCQLDRAAGALPMDGTPRLEPLRRDEAKQGWDWHTNSPPSRWSCAACWMRRRATRRA